MADAHHAPTKMTNANALAPAPNPSKAERTRCIFRRVRVSQEYVGAKKLQLLAALGEAPLHPLLSVPFEPMDTWGYERQEAGHVASSSTTSQLLGATRAKFPSCLKNIIDSIRNSPASIVALTFPLLCKMIGVGNSPVECTVLQNKFHSFANGMP